MINNENPSFNEFINRAKNFHASQEAFQVIVSDNSLFFRELYEITTSFTSGIKNTGDICRHEMLNEILTEVQNLATSYINEFSIFGDDSFLNLCPDYLYEYRDDIIEHLDSTNSDIDIHKLLNKKFYYDVYNACFFTSICNFLQTSTRCKSLTLKEFVYNSSPSKYPESIPLRKADISDIRDRDKRLSQFELYEELILELDKEVDAFKRWKSRHLSNSDSYFTRREWSAIPFVLEHEMSVIYYLEGLPKNLESVFKNITNLYNLLHKERKAPDSTEQQSKLGNAFDKTNKRIEKMKYINYIEIGKYLIHRMKEKEKFYGISLYRFEMQYNYYSTINEVNHLLHTDDEDERQAILINSYLLKDIHFKEIKNAFLYIDDYISTAMYVSLFKTFMGIVNMASILVIDALIDNGLLGGNWNDFLLEALNEMAEKILYNPANIDYDHINEPDADAYFKGILATSIARYDL